MTEAVVGERTGAFIATKEHRRFAEFVDAVRKHRYIGLCFGAAGVGKTCSARRYARWDIAEHLLTAWGPRDPSDANVYAALAQSRAIFYTPSVCWPFRELQGDISRLITRVSVCIGSHVHKEKLVQTGQMCDLAEILIVDEAERLSNTGLEHLRDLFDRTGIGVVLVGMPGIEKRSRAIPNSTAASASLTITGPCRATSWLSCCPATGAGLALRSTMPTSPMPKLSRPSPASRAATSGCSTACSSRSDAS